MQDWQVTEDILIHLTHYETRVAIVSQGLVQEIWIERNQHERRVGNIYWAKIERIMPGMQAAFLSIGDDSVFLHVSDLIEYYNPNNEPIQKVLMDGQFLLVQLIKDAINGKNARATTNITIAGRNLVYLPYSQKIGVSHKIREHQERDKMRERLQKINQMHEGLEGGYILRTIANQANEDELQRDMSYLQNIWQNIKSNIRAKTAISLLYEDLSLSYRACRDLVRSHTKTIYVDDEKLYQDLASFTQSYIPQANKSLKYYDRTNQKISLMDLHQVEKEVQKSLERRVDLKSGGYLLFDHTHALTTIDVNTGAFTGRNNFEETIFQTNLEATRVIARQLRLRNIGGMIIIDFIDMKQEAQRQAILEALKKALQYDRTKTHVYGFTQLGLVEMTRKRTHESLLQIMSQPCHTCDGKGVLKTPQSICYEIMHQISEQAKQFKPNGFKVMAHNDVINRFSNEEKKLLKILSERLDRPIQLQTQEFTSVEMYQIALY